MPNYKRPEQGFNFQFSGINTRSRPDALPPTKYTLGQNIRAYSDTGIQTRPGYVQQFVVTGVPTDLRAYSALGTDNAPRLLVRTTNDQIWLDNGVQVGQLGNNAGVASGCAMIPFRPNQSSQSWMYIANGYDYQKFSAPNASNAVIQEKVGIAEPLEPCSTVPDSLSFIDAAYSGWTAGGTAGAITQNGNARSSDTAGTIIVDPASLSGSRGKRYSIQTNGSKQYQIGEEVGITGSPGVQAIIQDVIPSITQASSIPLSIQSIFYPTGTTGRCIIVPSQMPSGAAPQIGPNGTPLVSHPADSRLAGLRRGALVTLNSETCLILSVTLGPNNTISFEALTAQNHTAGETITGVPTIVVSGFPVTSIAAGATITSGSVSSSVTAGIGTLSLAYTAGSPNLFNQALFGSTVTPQPDDYLHVSVNISDPSQLVEGKILIDVGDGSFTQNYFYYSFRQSDLQSVLSGSQTQLQATQSAIQRSELDALASASQSPYADEANQIRRAFDVQIAASSAQLLGGNTQWTELWIPLTALTRVGNDQTLSLLNMNAIQASFNVLATVTCKIGSVATIGGFQPDVGQQGAPYYYRCRLKNTLTGAISNPSPATRYGITARRQQGVVTIPAYTLDDPGPCNWEIFRYGGTLTSWRFVGTVPFVSLTPTVFLDNYFDDAVGAGDSLDFDNFEPWPTVDVAFNGMLSSVCGTTALITTTNTNIVRWLPGTLVQLAGQQVYTLRTRPAVYIGTTYLLEFIENAGTGTSVAVSVPEPLIANQMLPYMWGPDANGTVFACGDPLRPGSVYFSKSNNPDSAPDSYNLELSPPSEPLLGGEIIDGKSVTFTSRRAWSLYAAFSIQAQYQAQGSTAGQRYTPVESPVGRGMGAPYAHCTDGKVIYFWTKDGISVTSTGAAQSLTDPDLYNLFPHEGIIGDTVVYNGVTIYPPDYSRAATFRLTYCNSYLYADYQDISGSWHTLVLDVRHVAWSVDAGPQLSCHYATEQQEGTLLTNTAAYPQLYAARVDGAIGFQAANSNDFGLPIVSFIGTCEWPEGDVRTNEQWGDIFLDLVPAAAAGVTAQPVALGAPVVPSTLVPSSTSRVQTPISLGGGILANFLGLIVSWIDDFTLQSVPTQLHVWQPSLIDKPETITDRMTDWDDAGDPRAKYVQGFVLEADTFNQPLEILIRNGDSGAAQQILSITHNGQQEKAYSFFTPFVAHLLRLEPQGSSTPWRLFNVRWIFTPTPELVTDWQAQGTTFGIPGWKHVKQIEAAYAATAPVTLQLVAQDGTSPAAVVLPATGGIYAKKIVTLTFNKGLLYFLQANSAQPFQLFLEDCVFYVGGWGRQDNYLPAQLLGGHKGEGATI